MCILLVKHFVQQLMLFYTVWQSQSIKNVYQYTSSHILFFLLEHLKLILLLYEILITPFYIQIEPKPYKSPTTFINSLSICYAKNCDVQHVANSSPPVSSDSLSIYADMLWNRNHFHPTRASHRLLCDARVLDEADSSSSERS